MSYTTIEAKVLTLLQALAQYADAQVTRGDYSVLDIGYTQYCVIRPGPFEINRTGDWGMIGIDWTIYISLYERYTGDGTEFTNLETQRQNVIDMLNANPSLDGTTGVTLVLGRAPDVSAVYPVDSDTPQYLMQTIEARVHEEALSTTGEFA